MAQQPNVQNIANAFQILATEIANLPNLPVVNITQQLNNITQQLQQVQQTITNLNITQLQQVQQAIANRMYIILNKPIFCLSFSLLLLH
jgi:hypothetical protein